MAWSELPARGRVAGYMYARARKVEDNRTRYAKAQEMPGSIRAGEKRDPARFFKS